MKTPPMILKFHVNKIIYFSSLVLISLLKDKKKKKNPSQILVNNLINPVLALGN